MSSEGDDTGDEGDAHESSEDFGEEYMFGGRFLMASVYPSCVFVCLVLCLFYA